MPSTQAETDAYAAVLLNLARATDSLEPVEQSLADVVPVLHESEPLRAFVTDPVIDAEGKRRALRELLGDAVHPVLLGFLCLLVEQGGIARLKDIAAAFFEQVSDVRHSASGELVSPVELPAETVAAIEAETGRLLNKQVSLRTRIDRSLLGGVSVQVGDFVVDGTIDRQLERFRDQLMQ